MLLLLGEEEISEIESTKNEGILREHVKNISNDEGGLNAPKMWAVKRKLFPKSGDPPTAKLDNTSGNLITNSQGLKNYI